MKELIKNILIALVAIVVITIITIWSVIIGLIGGLVTVTMFAFDREKANKIYDQYKEILILPFKLCGVCDNWDEYTWWVKFNRL